MDFQVSAELIAIFLEDARGHLASLDQGLLRLEREGISAEVVGSLLGPLHTLKGNSGMMGFGSIKDYVHRLEDVLDKIRDGAVSLGPGAFDRLFAGVSALRGVSGERRPLRRPTGRPPRWPRWRPRPRNRLPSPRVPCPRRPSPGKPPRRARTWCGSTSAASTTC